MRTVVINGSPRKMGNTAAMLKEMAKFADEEGSRTDYLDLIDLRIADCKACTKCRAQGECAQKDDLAMLSTVIKEADLLMLGSPVYMGAETGLMKCFTDRLFSLAAGASPTELESRLTGKRKAIALFTCEMANGDRLYSYLSARYARMLGSVLNCEPVLTAIVPSANPALDLRQSPKATETLERSRRFIKG